MARCCARWESLVARPGEHAHLVVAGGRGGQLGVGQEGVLLEGQLAVLGAAEHVLDAHDVVQRALEREAEDGPGEAARVREPNAVQPTQDGRGHESPPRQPRHHQRVTELRVRGGLRVC